ncbi:prealbumin-like fold domain-containing protein, partial [Klebsiella pneumoniae]|nr:prealbumin-like fold domain-containing protein [Klebsiella pneumoniae]
TPATPTTPIMPDAPTTPTTPTTPANGLVVVGTAAKVIVSKAKPYAYVTVMNVSDSQVHSNFGSIITNERGEAIFTGLPAGKYYVIESANGV